MGFQNSICKDFLSSFNLTYHGYSYNKSVITKLFGSGFRIELKGGYK